MRAFVRNIILLVNLFFVLLLIGCYLSAFVSALTIPFFGLLNLGYPLLLLINLGFVLFWILFLKKYFLISLIAICIRIDYIPAFFQIRTANEVVESNNQIRIMSFNIHSFRHGNDDKTPQIQNTLDLIQQWKPDIVCMQEFSSKKDDRLKAFDEIKKLTGKYYSLPRKSKLGNKSGNIIFSRFPIINEGIVNEDLKYSYKLMFADIVTSIDTFRVYNIHLASFGLNENDAKVLEELTENRNLETQKSKNLIRKLLTAQKEHAQEVELLREHIAKSPHKVIICGDFNDTPSSYAYRQLKKNMRDAFIQKGRSFGTTYAGRFPAFRIDYILHDKSYETVDFKLEKATYSDHYPIFAILQSLEE